MAISITGVQVDESSSFTNPIWHSESGQQSSLSVSGLTPNTRYYTRGYVISDGTTVYSQNIKSFKTPDYLRFYNPNDYDIQLMLNKVNNPEGIILETCYEGTYQWVEWDLGVSGYAITIPAGMAFYFRGNAKSTFFSLALGYSSYGWYNFSCTDPIEVSGNLMTLLNYENPSTNMTGASFAYLFKDMTGLENTGLKLPATTLSDTMAYASLFEGCSSMTVAPKLPATILKQYCYMKMFKNSGIKEAPELPATAINADSPYWEMFRGARQLVKAPVLVATSDTVYVNTYTAMFKECVSLESIEIYGDFLSSGMLQDCASLNTIIYRAPTFNTALHSNWVLDAGDGSGSFYNLGRASIPTGDSGIPTGWTEYNSL